MKITASKKTIVILSISFLLLLLGVFVFVYKDVIRNGFKYGRWFVLDKHEGELLDYCEHEEGDKELNIKCRGFMVNTSENHNSKSKSELCGGFYIVDKKGQGWKKFVPCLDEQNFLVQHIYLKPLHYMPVDIEIKYIKRGFFKYRLDKISVEDMDSMELVTILNGNNTKVNNIAMSIATQEDIRYEKDGFLPLKVGILDDYPYMTYFKTLNLKEVSTEDSKVRLLFQGTIFDKSITMEVFSSSFLLTYYDKTKEQKEILVNKENYNELTLNAPYRVHFFSLTEKEQDRLDEIVQSCKNNEKQEDIAFRVFCASGEEQIRNSVISNVYTYIEELLLEDKHIQPEKFILFSLYAL